MPIYLLDDSLVFPPPEGASEEGVVAVGGDLSSERLHLAYASGIFPWPTADLPLLWFSPDPRFVLPLEAVRISRSLRKAIRRTELTIRADTAFEEVIRACAAVPRPGQDGTWITDELIEGYSALHERGLAHSIEAWNGGRLVGGLYGVSLGSFFFGESMFAEQTNASKVAFTTLLGQLKAWGFDLVDAQVHTEHLASFGAFDLPREHFLDSLRAGLRKTTRRGSWKLELGPRQALEVLLGEDATIV